jgi:hypothetical protein
MSRPIGTHDHAAWNAAYDAPHAVCNEPDEHPKMRTGRRFRYRYRGARWPSGPWWRILGWRLARDHQRRMAEQRRHAIAELLRRRFKEATAPADARGLAAADARAR